MTPSINTITLELPVKVEPEEAKRMILFSLFGKGVLSSGIAASYLDINRVDFLEQATQYGISIFSDDEDNLADALDISL